MAKVRYRITVKTPITVGMSYRWMFGSTEVKSGDYFQTVDSHQIEKERDINELVRRSAGKVQAKIDRTFMD